MFCNIRRHRVLKQKTEGRKVFFFEKKKQKTFALILLLATGIRLLAAYMPLSADEAYYRVWAHALAPGYLDHPPIIALWIRAGTSLAGETPIGIRLLSPFSVLLGSYWLLRAGEDLAPGQGVGVRAVWFLNATLLLNAGAVTATPDTPLLMFWVAALAALARLVRTGNANWWFAAGAAGGLAFDSKYTGALLAPATLAWLVAVPSLRPWLRRWQPYAALALAILLATPVLVWNATHHWASFARQGGRTGDWHFANALSHVAELVAGQVGLATPLLFALFAAGTILTLRHRAWQRPATGLLAALTLVPACVFLQHALGDRVQANWPAIVYPSLALGAAMVPLAFIQRAAATGVGLLLSGLVMLQAAASPFSLPRRLDFSLIRLAGWTELAHAADAARLAAKADCIAADEYGLASELAYHLRVPVLGVEPRWALFALAPPPPACATVLLVRSARRTDTVPRDIRGRPDPVGGAARARDGITAEYYLFYRAARPLGAVLLPARN
jgi:4-amino-4-deoxy-L-arabinose transferase-like glycosyltransferase